MEGEDEIPYHLDAYNDYLDRIREIEYPMLKDAVYLDHAGTTLYSRSLMERFHADMMANLFGNPHSASPSSQKSTQEVENVRLQLLRFFNADPDHFDLVFIPNATAGIKLVGDAFRDCAAGFSYGYHVDSHTSLVGVREVATVSRCLSSDEEVKSWIAGPDDGDHCERPRLFAYPAQSNMHGRRLPMGWCQTVCRNPQSPRTYTLLDAAAYASTSRLDLGVADIAADFTVLSLYKIFGFPDLGALIVKKSAAHVFKNRRYFGGGTVEMVVCMKEQWHARKQGALHEQLEDGTLSIHSILALKSALRTHKELFGTLEQISQHTASLAKLLYDGLSSLKHSNSRYACKVYKHAGSEYGNSTTQGPIVAFNLCDSKGDWVSNTEVEKLASIRNIHLRTGGVCNPGGVATALNLAPWEMRDNFSAGRRCGGENDLVNGRPTGVIRLSLGAMSTRSDVERFIAFLSEFFVDKAPPPPDQHSPIVESCEQRFHVESLMVYPIKSCGGWQIPDGTPWDVRTEGLAWDREWCIVHRGTGKSLSQKQHPRMALLRPSLCLKAGMLYVRVVGTSDEISIPLSRNPTLYASSIRHGRAIVCDDGIDALMYVSPAIAEFFSRLIGVDCTLARFNPASTTGRHSKAHLQLDHLGDLPAPPRPILLSNESPILTISRSSLNRLNEHIKAKGGKVAHASVFRANIVLAENPLLPPGQEQPWAEDAWCGMRVGGAQGAVFEFLGGCRRCQMVCVDQESGDKNAEPLVTLAKTRRHRGRVLFGVHTALAKQSTGKHTTIRAGDVIEAFGRDDETAA